jgi:hypothetical protein
VPGKSPQAASFKNKNPQDYKEPTSRAAFASEASAILASDWPGMEMATNQTEANFQSANEQEA